jgi:hypothetical protein
MAQKPKRFKHQLRPAHREPGTLRQQLESIRDFLDLQEADPLVGHDRERRWEVVHALRCGRDIPPRRPR